MGKFQLQAGSGPCQPWRQRPPMGNGSISRAQRNSQNTLETVVLRESMWVVYEHHLMSLTAVISEGCNRAFSADTLPSCHEAVTLKCKVKSQFPVIVCRNYIFSHTHYTKMLIYLNMSRENARNQSEYVRPKQFSRCDANHNVSMPVCF